MMLRDDLVLLVVDLQEKLLPTISGIEKTIVQCVKLIRFARVLNIPILWTEHYPKGLGPTAGEIASELKGLAPLEKISFGCLGEPKFRKALEETGKKQLLIAGIETQVCVMQTTLMALEAGYEVYVPRDAVASRAKNQYKAGLARMEKAGAQLVTVEMAMFEALRVGGTPEFKKILPLIK